MHVQEARCIEKRGGRGTRYPYSHLHPMAPCRLGGWPLKPPRDTLASRQRKEQVCTPGSGGTPVISHKVLHMLKPCM